MEVTLAHLETVHRTCRDCSWLILKLLDKPGKVCEADAIALLSAMKAGQLGMNPERIDGVTAVQSVFIAAHQKIGDGIAPTISGGEGSCFHGAVMNLVKHKVFAGIDTKTKRVENRVDSLTAGQLARITKNIGALDRGEVESAIPRLERESVAAAALLSGEDKIEVFVTLSQVAPLVNRSKRTLEKFKDKMPMPRISDGGGKADEWYWSELRPWLENYSGRKLPKQFPQFTRN